MNPPSFNIDDHDGAPRSRPRATASFKPRQRRWWWLGTLGLAALLAGCAPTPRERELRSLWQQLDRDRPAHRQADSWLEDRRLPPNAGNDAASNPANANDADLPEDADFDALARYAMHHNPALEAAFMGWRAAIERIAQARSLPDPQLSFTGIIQQIDANPEWIGERYGLSQMVPWFGTLELRGEVATEEALAAERRFEAERLGVLDRLSQAYYEHAYLDRSIQVTRENRELAIQLERVARRRFETGEAPRADLLRAQVELGRIDDRLRSLRDLRGASAARINAVLGRAADAPLPPIELDVEPAPDPQPDNPAPDADFERLDDARVIEAAAVHNPDLAALSHESAARREGVALARKGYYPDLMFGIEYARGADTRMDRMDGGGRDMLMGMVSIELPIWRDRIVAEHREALADFGRTTHLVVDRRNELAAEIRQQLYEYREALRRLDLYGRTLLPTARQAVRTTEAAYRTGDAAFSDMVDAQRTLLEFELAHARAHADRHQSRHRLHRLIGRPLEEVIAPPEPPQAPAAPDSEPNEPQVHDDALQDAPNEEMPQP